MEVHTHPVTLEFDDETLEAELKSKVFNLPIVRAGVVLSLLLLLSVEQAGYGRSPLQYLTVLLMWLCAFVICYAPRCITRLMPETWNTLLNKPEKVHSFMCFFGTAAWVMCMALWWRLVLEGSLPRIRLDELGKILASCTMWLVTAVAMHVLHFPFKLRVVVLASALPIILSSEIKQPLLLSLAGGELIGYTLESIIRSNFLERADQVERLKQEKERVVYELNLTRHVQEALLRQKVEQQQQPGYSKRFSQASKSHDDYKLNDYSSVDLDSNGGAPPHTGAVPTDPDSPVRERYSTLHERSIAASTTSVGTNSEIAGISHEVEADQQAVSAADSQRPGLRQREGMQTAKAYVPTRSLCQPLLNLERTEALWRTLEDAGLAINSEKDRDSNCS